MKGYKPKKVNVVKLEKYLTKKEKDGNNTKFSNDTKWV